MKIVADENIPLVEYYFGAMNEIILKPGRLISNHDLMDADILLVRSVTPVNQALLVNTKIKFVGSATIGIDHVDTAWLEANGIIWSYAKGCNATAVVEYVVTLIAALQKQGFLLQKSKRAGVIGVGNIGAQVAEKLKILGFDVIQYDPLRALQNSNFISTALQDFSDLDFITLHTPLTMHGPYPTYHMIEKDFLTRQKQDCFLVNTGRGAAINFLDLKNYGKQLHWCLDVWEHEPHIDLAIVEKTLIATPHIAGYSVQSKYRSMEMLYQAALAAEIIKAEKINPLPYPHKKISLENSIIPWQEVLLKIFDPVSTSQNMKKVLSLQLDTFDNLRKNFQDRYEWDYVECKQLQLTSEDRVLLEKLSNHSLP